MVEWNDKRLIVYMQDTVGSDVATLRRRVGYGGRKGRSALRRLRRTPHQIVNVGVAIMRGAVTAKTE